MALPLPSSSSSRVTLERVGRAVDALLKWIKSQKKHQKAQLLEADELIYLILTLKKVPGAARTNPFKIPLPNPIHPTDGSEQMCLIIDDRSRLNRTLTSDIAKKKIQSESIPISKVIKLSKLKTDYHPFEAKRKLCDSYDLFFADKRIIPLLPRLLGKQFFKKKKIPIPIDLTKNNWKDQISQICSSTLLYLRTGTCSILKVGRVSQGRDEIVQNVAAAIEGVPELVPKKWAGIRSFHLKSLESVALPIYQTVPDIGLKIEGYMKKVEEGQAGGVSEKIKNDCDPPEVSAKKIRKTSKKGRIHEVRYMDGDIDRLMADIASEDGDDAKDVNEMKVEDVMAGEETKKEKKKQNKREQLLGDLDEMPKKLKKKKKVGILEAQHGVSRKHSDGKETVISTIGKAKTTSRKVEKSKEGKPKKKKQT